MADDPLGTTFPATVRVLAEQIDQMNPSLLLEQLDLRGCSVQGEVDELRGRLLRSSCVQAVRISVPWNVDRDERGDRLPATVAALQLMESAEGSRLAGSATVQSAATHSRDPAVAPTPTPVNTGPQTSGPTSAGTSTSQQIWVTPLDNLISTSLTTPTTTTVTRVEQTTTAALPTISTAQTPRMTAGVPTPLLPVQQAAPLLPSGLVNLWAQHWGLRSPLMMPPQFVELLSTPGARAGMAFRHADLSRRDGQHPLRPTQTPTIQEISNDGANSADGLGNGSQNGAVTAQSTAQSGAGSGRGGTLDNAPKSQSAPQSQPKDGGGNMPPSTM